MKNIAVFTHRGKT